MLIDGSIPGTGEPRTLGHEGAGFVEKMGANVKGFQKGDEIGFLYIKGCCCEYPSRRLGLLDSMPETDFDPPQKLSARDVRSTI